MLERARNPALQIGPYALLACASVVSGAPALAVAASLGANLLAPRLGSLWEQCCRGFLSDQELQQRPLRGALVRAIDAGIADTQRRWWSDTAAGRRQHSQSVLGFNTGAAKEVERTFANLRAALHQAASADAVRDLLAQPAVQFDLGSDESATVGIFREFLTVALDPPMSLPLAEFVAAELPPAVARALTAEVYSTKPEADAVRFAFDRLTQRLQTALLLDIAASSAIGDAANSRLSEKLARLRELDPRQLDQEIVGGLEAVLQQQSETLATVRQIAEAVPAAQASKVRVVPAADLRIGGTGPRIDVNVPKWDPTNDLALPHERDATRLLKQGRALLLKGKPSSGKTHLAAKLMRVRPQALVVIPRSFDAPPPFGDLVGAEVVLFIDDFHERARTFDPNPWWDALAEACGEDATSLLVTTRSGDYWKEILDSRRSFLDRLPPGSEFDIPELDANVGEELGVALGLTPSERKRFDGTIGSLALDFSEMGDAYRRLADEHIDGVSSGRLLDAAKLLHSVRQPSLPEDVLRRVSEEVQGGGQRITPERWRTLKRRTEEQGFGRFDGPLFITYAPYLEREEVIEYRPDISDIEKVSAVLLDLRNKESLFYLGLAALADWNLPIIAKAAYSAGMELGEGKAASNLGLLLEERGDQAGAEAAWRRGVELGRGGAAANLGVLLMQQGRVEEAEATWRRGTELGEGGEAARNLGVLLKQQGRVEEAEAAWRRGIDLGHGAAAFALGLLPMQQGRVEEGEAAYSSGVELGHGAAALALGLLLEERGDQAGAETAWRQGAELGEGEAAFALGLLLKQKGRLEEAEAAINLSRQLGFEYPR